MAAPSIPPVPSDVSRPRWSVMIPAYNCAAYLAQTIESVLDQDPGPASMQIAVVDDASTKDDPEEVVRRAGRGRVEFYRQPRNLGATGNFNSCLARSRGEWVHLLHGDDFVLPGFYEQLAAAIARTGDVALASVRTLAVDEHGRPAWMSPRLPELESGGRRFAPLQNGNPLQTPAVVVRRAFYEQHGGFLPELVHAADWEMWHRAVELGGGVAVNLPLACYREFAGNDTSRLMRTGENLRDFLRLANALQPRTAPAEIAGLRRFTACRAKAQARRFRRLGDHEAARANAAVYQELAGMKVTVRNAARQALQALRSLRRAG